MADIVTGTVTGQLDTSTLQRDHADIRREVATETCDVIDSVKTAGWLNSDRTGTEADRIVAQGTAHFIASQYQNSGISSQLAAVKMAQNNQSAQTLAAIQAANAHAIAEMQLATCKVEANSNANRAALAQLVAQDGNSTRALINSLKMDELNRLLNERNTELVEHRGDVRHYREGLYSAQQAALVSQISALHSQFQQATQGTVNFGTMSGNAGRNTSTNNVV